jgi:NAD(P)-dependent dehydrogenase (short-subunit alcohol dehydrogenase family)
MVGSLEGRVAIVTGASGGIGKAICRILAINGANIVTHYLHDREGVEIAATAVREAGRQVEIVSADVAVVAEVQALVKKVLERFGRLDILVNNVGIFPRSWALEMSEEEWDKVLDTNLKGTFMCSQAAAQVMKQVGGGRIVNISSLAIQGRARGAHYSASKAGIIGLTRALAVEWAPEILVNCVVPGIIDTPQPRMGMTEEQIAERVSRIPIPRIGRPEDIAQAVLFFVSDSSSWITGQTLHVNGGDMMF